MDLGCRRHGPSLGQSRKNSPRPSQDADACIMQLPLDRDLKVLASTDSWVPRSDDHTKGGVTVTSKLDPTPLFESAARPGRSTKCFSVEILAQNLKSTAWLDISSAARSPSGHDSDPKFGIFLCGNPDPKTHKFFHGGYFGRDVERGTYSTTRRWIDRCSTR